MSKPIGPNGLRLIKQFEKGNPKVVPCSTEGAALGSYKDDVGVWTASFGCTIGFDGKPIGPGLVLTEEEADALLLHNLERFEDGVDQLLRRPVTETQRDALIALAFNIGLAAFAEPCTALRETNAGNWELAAQGFGLFSGETTEGPSKEQVHDPEYQDVIGHLNGEWIWLGPERQPCGYMTRVDGLLRRHLSEGVLYSGYDWTKACAEGKVSVTLKPPAAKLWNAGKKRWEDRIERQTTLADVLVTAERYPLVEDPEIFEAPAEPATPPPTDEQVIAHAGAEPVPEPASAQVKPPAVETAQPTEANPAPAQSPAIAIPGSKFGGNAPVKPIPEVPILPPVPAPPAILTPLGPVSKEWYRSQTVWGGIIAGGARIAGRVKVATMTPIAGTLAFVSDNPAVQAMAVTLLIVAASYVAEHWGEWHNHNGKKNASGTLSR